MVKLLHDAIRIDVDFEQFQNVTEKATNFYFESRYPMGYEVEYTEEEVGETLSQTKRLIKLIKEKTK